ncbi:MAG: phosphoribosylglycinamide formyltransferase [Bacteroidota bacterium]|nr:MAG: phosphoribosylglycinamide formyltransferase [Bacteroidota bacterium]
MNKIAIFASGSGTNAENIALHFRNHPSVVVDSIYCNKPDAFVLQRAERLGIPAFLFQRESFYQSSDLLETLQQRKIDYLILAGFLWLIPAYLIQAYPQRIINIHPALLPKYGGKGMYGMHVHEAVKNSGDKETGISIHFVNEHYDEGNIIFQARCAISPTDSPAAIAEKVHQLEYTYFPQTIEKVILSGKYQH